MNEKPKYENLRFPRAENVMRSYASIAFRDAALTEESIDRILGEEPIRKEKELYIKKKPIDKGYLE